MRDRTSTPGRSGGKNAITPTIGSTGLDLSPAADDFVVTRPDWIDEAQWRTLREKLAAHMASAVEKLPDVAAHAPWCAQLAGEALGCNGLECHMFSDGREFPATGMAPRTDERGDAQHSEVRLGVERVLTAAARRGKLVATDTHVISMTTELEGWSEDKWVGLTVSQARALRDGLGEVIALCESDAVALHAENATLLDCLGVEGSG